MMTRKFGDSLICSITHRLVNKGAVYIYNMYIYIKRQYKTWDTMSVNMSETLYYCAKKYKKIIICIRKKVIIFINKDFGYTGIFMN